MQRLEGSGRWGLEVLPYLPRLLFPAFPSPSLAFPASRLRVMEPGVH